MGGTVAAAAAEALHLAVSGRCIGPSQLPAIAVGAWLGDIGGAPRHSKAADMLSRVGFSLALWRALRCTQAEPVLHSLCFRLRVL